MKKTLMICLSAVLVASLFSCSGKGHAEAGSDEPLDFGVIKKDTTVSLSSSAASPKAEIRLNLHYATGHHAQEVNTLLFKSGILTPDYFCNDSVVPEPHKAVGLFLEKYAADYKKDYGDMYRRDPSHTESYQVQYFCSTNIKKGRKGVVNYLADISYFGGGTHPVDYIIALNIDRENGKLVQLSDVFSSDYEDMLTQKIVDALCEKYRVKNLSELREHSIFMDMEPYVTNNYILGKKHITFIYVDSEIAPHSEGQIEVDVEYGE